MKICGVCKGEITGESYKDELGLLCHNKCIRAKSIIVAKESPDLKKIKASIVPSGMSDYVLRKNTIGETNAEKGGSVRSKI